MKSLCPFVDRLQSKSGDHSNRSGGLINHRLWRALSKPEIEPRPPHHFKKNPTPARRPERNYLPPGRLRPPLYGTALASAIRPKRPLETGKPLISEAHYAYKKNNSRPPARPDPRGRL